MFENTGDKDIESANDANVPVNIFITRADENVSHKWELSADNFMPCKNRAADGAYCVEADTKKELLKLVKQYILPLYQIAIRNIEAMIEGSEDGFYYWTEPKPKK